MSLFHHLTHLLKSSVGIKCGLVEYFKMFKLFQKHYSDERENNVEKIVVMLIQFGAMLSQAVISSINLSACNQCFPYEHYLEYKINIFQSSLHIVSLLI